MPDERGGPVDEAAWGVAPAAPAEPVSAQAPAPTPFSYGDLEEDTARMQHAGRGYSVIDFNRAYNPYCYYNVAYECPYPPPANRLKMPIRAGERMKKSE